jgi:hypothetical protein
VTPYRRNILGAALCLLVAGLLVLDLWLRSLHWLLPPLALGVMVLILLALGRRKVRSKDYGSPTSPESSWPAGEDVLRTVARNVGRRVIVVAVVCTAVFVYYAALTVWSWLTS